MLNAPNKISFMCSTNLYSPCVFFYIFPFSLMEYLLFRLLKMMIRNSRCNFPIIQLISLPCLDKLHRLPDRFVHLFLPDKLCLVWVKCAAVRYTHSDYYQLDFRAFLSAFRKKLAETNKQQNDFQEHLFLFCKNVKRILCQLSLVKT